MDYIYKLNIISNEKNKNYLLFSNRDILTPPSMPIINAIVPGDKQAVISYSPPLYNGGAIITKYTAKIYDNLDNFISSIEIAATNPLTDIIISGLTNGITYNIKLSATNSEGDSLLSLPMSVTPNTEQNTICYIGESIVLVQDKETGITSEVYVKDVTSEKYLVFSTTQQKFVELKINCISGYTDKFILIKKDLFGENKPSQDFYVTPSHPILVEKYEIKAKNITGAKKITLEKKQIYTLVTDNREALLINNIDVICWEYNNFMKKYMKYKNVIWYRNDTNQKNIIKK
jgi:hypothetical protein